MRIFFVLILCGIMITTVPFKSPVAAYSNSDEYYEGFLDYAGKSGVFGWDSNLNDLSERVNVTVFIDGKEVATVAANLFRVDLESATSDGKHAFFYQLPAWYFDGVEHTISVKHETGGTQTRTELYSSPRTFTCLLD